MDVLSYANGPARTGLDPIVRARIFDTSAMQWQSEIQLVKNVRAPLQDTFALPEAADPAYCKNLLVLCSTHWLDSGFIVFVTLG